jgi:hypothetical protein
MPRRADSPVELARRVMEVWNEGVSEVLARYDEFCTEDYEWNPPVGRLTGGPYIGREGFARYVADVKESLGEVRIKLLGDPEEIAPDLVRMNVKVHGEGPQSGVVVDAPLVALVRFREGLVCWAWGSYDPAEAEKVAGSLARGEEVSI